MPSKVTLDGKLMFPKDYLAAVEFQDRDVTLTIASVGREDLIKIEKKKKVTESKPVLTFKETKKKLVLNVTNATTIAELYGYVAEEWLDKRITLYPTRGMAFGQIQDMIRVREKVTETGAEPPPDNTGPASPQTTPEEADEFSKMMNNPATT